MKWIQKNFKTIIYTAFLIPIFLVAAVSISHVTQWYSISNPMSWSLYLSVAIEIAALSALAAIAAKMGKKVYFPFIVVTLIQFLGNIYFAYSYIDLNSKTFKDWVDMVDPIVSFMGVESGDLIGHKRFLALFAGGLLPLISLSFLHMLIKFEEEDKQKEIIETKVLNDQTSQVLNAPLDELVQQNQDLGLYDNLSIDENSEKNTEKEQEIKLESQSNQEDINNINPILEVKELTDQQQPEQVSLSQDEVSKTNDEVIENLEEQIRKISQEKNIEEVPLPPTSKKTKKVLSYTKRDV